MRMFWTPEEIERLRRIYPTMHTRKVARLMGRSVSSVYGAADKYDVRKTEEYLASPDACRLRRGLVPGSVRHQFKKGIVPWNKGRKGVHYSRATEFKKGHLPQTTLFDGAITIRTSKSGRHGKRRSEKWIRLGLREWLPVRVHNWIKHRGPVPKGMFVVFRTADTMDTRLSNLQLVSRADHMRNTHKTDAVIALRIARKKDGRRGTHIDREMYHAALASPELLRLKRAELELKSILMEGKRG